MALEIPDVNDPVTPWILKWIERKTKREKQRVRSTEFKFEICRPGPSAGALKEELNNTQIPSLVQTCILITVN